MVANNMGAMTPNEVGLFLKGYFLRSKEMIPLGIQKAGMLGAAFPTQALATQRLEFWTTQGNPGRMEVALDAPVEDTQYKINHYTKDLMWDKYAFMVTDAATDAIMVDDITTTQIGHAMNFFAQLEDYRKIVELKAKNDSNCTAAAAAHWHAANADMEGDIIAGIETIVKYTGINPSTVQFGLVYPSDCLRGTEQLDLIHNVQQTLKSYLKSIFPINFYPYTAFMDADGNKYIDVKEQTSSDALTTSALLFVEGRDTMRCGRYTPSSIPTTETTRIHDVGYKTTLRNSFGCLAVPRYNASTTPLIYEVTGVTS